MVDISLEVVVLLVVVHPELGTGVAGPSAGLTLPVALQEITQAFLGSILKLYIARLVFMKKKNVLRSTALQTPLKNRNLFCKKITIKRLQIKVITIF